MWQSLMILPQSRRFCQLSSFWTKQPILLFRIRSFFMRNDSFFKVGGKTGHRLFTIESSKDTTG